MHFVSRVSVKDLFLGLPKRSGLKTLHTKSTRGSITACVNIKWGLPFGDSRWTNTSCLFKAAPTFTQCCFKKTNVHGKILSASECPRSKCVASIIICARLYFLTQYNQERHLDPKN